MNHFLILNEKESEYISNLIKDKEGTIKNNENIINNLQGINNKLMDDLKILNNICENSFYEENQRLY